MVLYASGWGGDSLAALRWLSFQLNLVFSLYLESPMNNVDQLLKVDRLECSRCNGAGNKRYDAFTSSVTGKFFPEHVKDCPFCDGRGYFDRPEFTDIWAKIKGRKPCSLRSKRPDDNRDYYVWRMIRFHSGKDVTLPMTASISVAGDPFVPLLDQYAEAAAQIMTGHKSAGVARWQSALYGTDPQERYLPESAFAGGPVVTDHKPFDESLELF